MISIKVDASQALKELSDYPRKMRSALENAIDTTAFQVRDTMRETMKSVFDRPTAFTLNSLKVTKTKGHNMIATVWFKEPERMQQHYLVPEVMGGQRKLKGFERAFGNWYTAPGKGAESLNMMDSHGNFKSSQIKMLMSYFGKSAFLKSGGVGHNFDATAATRAKRAKMRREDINGRKISKSTLAKNPNAGYLTIGGQVFFVSLGKGNQIGNRVQHLAAGIWAKSGTHGVVLKPLLMKTRTQSYRPRLMFYDIARQVVNSNFDANVRAEVAKRLQL